MEAYLVCSIQDTGVGMAQEDVEKLGRNSSALATSAVRDVPVTCWLSIAKNLIRCRAQDRNPSELTRVAHFRSRCGGSGLIAWPLIDRLSCTVADGPFPCRRAQFSHRGDSIFGTSVPITCRFLHAYATVCLSVIAQPSAIAAANALRRAARVPP